MATIQETPVIHETPIHDTDETPKHLDSDRSSRHLQFDRTFITRPGSPAGTVNDEERSMLITFVAFAIILAISALAVMALLNEGGSGSVTTFTEGMATALTPNITS